MSSIEQLGVTPLQNLDEVFALSDPVTEASVRTGDLQLARSAFTAVARILEKTGYVSTALAESFILESEQRIADLE